MTSWPTCATTARLARAATGYTSIARRRSSGARHRRPAPDEWVETLACALDLRNRFCDYSDFCNSDTFLALQRQPCYVIEPVHDSSPWCCRYEVQDLRVIEYLPQMVVLSETYFQVWQLQGQDQAAAKMPSKR